MHVSLIDCSISSQAQPSHRTEQSKPRGRGGDFDSDEAKTRGKRTKEQVQAKNRNKYKTRTETRTTPHNQTRRQAGGFGDSMWFEYSHICGILWLVERASDVSGDDPVSAHQLTLGRLFDWCRYLCCRTWCRDYTLLASWTKTWHVCDFNCLMWLEPRHETWPIDQRANSKKWWTRMNTNGQNQCTDNFEQFQLGIYDLNGFNDPWSQG